MCNNIRLTLIIKLITPTAIYWQEEALETHFYLLATNEVCLLEIKPPCNFCISKEDFFVAFHHILHALRLIQCHREKEL